MAIYVKQILYMIHDLGAYQKIHSIIGGRTEIRLRKRNIRMID